MPEFQDRGLKCVDCGADFVFTAGEQQFYHEKNFSNEPRRCKACKSKRQPGSGDRGGRSGGGYGGSQTAQRTETTTNCSQCGRETTVPFKPTQGRPVLCRDCFRDSRA